MKADKKKKTSYTMKQNRNSIVSVNYSWHTKSSAGYIFDIEETKLMAEEVWESFETIRKEREDYKAKVYANNINNFILNNCFKRHLN